MRARSYDRGGRRGRHRRRPRPGGVGLRSHDHDLLADDGLCSRGGEQLRRVTDPDQRHRLCHRRRHAAGDVQRHAGRGRVRRLRRGDLRPRAGWREARQHHRHHPQGHGDEHRRHKYHPAHRTAGRRTSPRHGRDGGEGGRHRVHPCEGHDGDHGHDHGANLSGATAVRIDDEGALHPRPAKKITATVSAAVKTGKVSVTVPSARS